MNNENFTGVINISWQLESIICLVSLLKFYNEKINIRTSFKRIIVLHDHKEMHPHRYPGNL